MARKPKLNVQTIPPPFGGWNARDPRRGMDAKFALVLDNLIPDVKGVRLRGGTSVHATGLGAPVETIMEFNEPGGSQRLLAAAGSSLWDVTEGGVPTIELKTDLTNARLQSVQFSTPGGLFLAMVNGADGYFTYDSTNGGTFTDRTAAITGTDGAVPTKWATVTIHMSRLWFLEAGSADVWYLPAQALQGDATKFPLGSLLPLGGEIVAMGSWTRDGGSGMDDYAVFVSSRGEVLVYRGTDPDTAATWDYVGRFKIPEPIGRRCLVKAGADLAILTSQGLVPLSALLSLNESGQTGTAFTDAIVDAFRTAYNTAGRAFGWGVTEFASRNLVLVNVPLAEGGPARQFVANVRTSGWCRFTGLNAACWSAYGARLFYGGVDGTVYEYDETAYTDAGQPIVGIHLSAFLELKNPGFKQFLMAKPRFTAPEGFVPTIRLKLEYDESAVPVENAVEATQGPQWGEGVWGVSLWGAAQVSTAVWQSVGGIATAAAIGFGVSSSSPIVYEGVDLTWKSGGLL